MFERRRAVDLRGYRSALAGRGDVAIGALARRRRRRNFAVAALGVVLMVAAWWLYCLAPAERIALTGDEFRYKVRCIECGYIGVLSAKPGQSFPLICPECRTRGCKELWQCQNCGWEFLPDKSGTTVRCSDCGSVSVGSALSPSP